MLAVTFTLEKKNYAVAFQLLSCLLYQAE